MRKNWRFNFFGFIFGPLRYTPTLIDIIGDGALYVDPIKVSMVATQDGEVTLNFGGTSLTLKLETAIKTSLVDRIQKYQASFGNLGEIVVEQ